VLHVRPVKACDVRVVQPEDVEAVRFSASYSVPAGLPLSFHASVIWVSEFAVAEEFVGTAANVVVETTSEVELSPMASVTFTRNEYAVLGVSDENEYEKELVAELVVPSVAFIYMYGAAARPEPVSDAPETAAETPVDETEESESAPGVGAVVSMLKAAEPPFAAVYAEAAPCSSIAFTLQYHVPSGRDDVAVYAVWPCAWSVEVKSISAFVKPDEVAIWISYCIVSALSGSERSNVNAGVLVEVKFPPTRYAGPREDDASGDALHA
jgi:hypothetical protein